MEKTQYVLGTVFTIDANVLAPDLRDRVRNRAGKCLVLLEHRFDAARFRVKVAASWEALQSEEGAFISILSAFQLSLANARRVGCSDACNMVQVAPASILPPEMRPLYSSVGLCYYLPAGPADACGRREVTVAALPERLRPYGQGRIVSFVLNGEQLALALNYTPDLAAMPTGDVRERVSFHCKAIAPEMLSAQQQPVSGQGATPIQREQHIAYQPTPTQLLEKVFVPVTKAAEAARSIVNDRYTMRRWREKMWLRACLYTLALGDTHTLRQQTDLGWHIRQVLVGYLYRQDLPRLVEVDPVYYQGEVIGYDIQVTAPIEAA